MVSSLTVPGQGGSRSCFPGQCSNSKSSDQFEKNFPPFLGLEKTLPLPVRLATHPRINVLYHFFLSSRGNPSVQANSVLGLAGLASTMATYMAQQTDSESRRETDSEGSPGSDSASQEQQYQGSREWLVIVADTMIVILDGNYKAKGPTLQWCQQVCIH